MRDILVCKKCEWFIENHLDPSIKKLHDSRTLYDTKWIEKYQPYFRRRHCCWHDDFKKTYSFDEFYKMPVPRNCPYAMEHEIYSWNSDMKNVDYDFTRYFRRNRTCQHCGRKIPNRKRCDNCGYDWFNVYTPYNETSLMIQVVTIAFLVMYILVDHFFFGG